MKAISFRYRISIVGLNLSNCDFVSGTNSEGGLTRDAIPIIARAGVLGLLPLVAFNDGDEEGEGEEEDGGFREFE